MKLYHFAFCDDSALLGKINASRLECIPPPTEAAEPLTATLENALSDMKTKKVDFAGAFTPFNCLHLCTQS